MSAPVPTLRIDATGTAFGTAPTYTDRTSYLMTGSQYPVDVTFGRQDEQSEPQPSTCSFFLSNANGFWTPGAGVGPAGWDIGCPVNVRLTANAVTYDRFTGYVDSIEPTWPGGVQSWSVVKVTCTDVAARLGIAKPLRSLLLHEMLADSPTYLYPLGEAVGATSAATITGTARTAVKAGSGGRLDFGTEMTGLIDPAVGVRTTAAISPVSVLDLPPLIPSSGAVSIACWILAPDVPPANTGVIFMEKTVGATTSSDPSSRWLIYMTPAGLLVYSYGDYDQLATITSASSFADGRLHQVVGTLDAARTSMTLYVDGQSAGTAASSAATPGATTVAVVGGEFIGGAQGYQLGFDGVISHVAIYPSELSAARVLAHYQAGVGTGPSERSDQRFSRIAGYGGITTSGLPTGVATMGGQATSGQTAITALAKVARTEGTFAYVTTAGALTFQARTHRYHRAVGLALAASDIATPGVRRDRQGVANEITVTREGGAAQVVIDSTSQTAIGRFDGGSFEVCPSTDEDAWQGATWQVQNRKTTRTRLPDLTVDLYRQTSTAVVASCLSATIGTKAQVTSLPANAPAATMTLFVEGYTETIGYDRWAMGFYTSPVGLEDSVLVLDNATTGVLDTYRLGF